MVIAMFMRSNLIRLAGVCYFVIILGQVGWLL